MKRFFLSALAATTVIAGGVALAQPPEPRGPGFGSKNDFLTALDTNKDGVITRAEFTADLEKRFMALDTDKNGVISAAERKAARDAKRAERLNARFTALDTDKNNQISREEFFAGHDGRPGPDDAMAGPGAPPPPPPGGPQAGGGDPERGREGPGRGFGHGHFAPGGPDDREAQGDVTKEQFMARPLRLFDVLDSNDDGKITAAEREAGRDRGGHRGPGREGPPPAK